MKYKSKVKSKQSIQIGEGKKVFILPGEGEMTDEEANAVAKTPWGKRLIETKFLEFEKPVEMKEEEKQRGMTIKPGSGKSNRRKKAKPNTEVGTEGGTGNEPAGDTGGDEIPDFGNGSGDPT
jgi:hypothetical protein